MLYKDEKEKKLFKMVQGYSTYKHDVRKGGKAYRKLGYFNDMPKPYGKDYIEEAQKEKNLERK